ncbi:hypothetical protein AA0323_2762 [Asaia siamensis NRIC 0323]|nr:hypothetical protein AA0323_2762 [Asaia siamensis NRIC 0323]
MGTVIKDMAKMTTACRAPYLRALHAKTVIPTLLNSMGQRCRETWPARPAFELAA